VLNIHSFSVYNGVSQLESLFTHFGQKEERSREYNGHIHGVAFIFGHNIRRGNPDKKKRTSEPFGWYSTDFISDREREILGQLRFTHHQGTNNTYHISVQHPSAPKKVCEKSLGMSMKIPERKTVP
jgi:hypothetical protein